jgi:hypothetical protein
LYTGKEEARQTNGLMAHRLTEIISHELMRFLYFCNRGTIQLRTLASLEQKFMIQLWYKLNMSTI